MSPNTPRFKLPIIAFSFTKIAIIKVRKKGIQTMNINSNNNSKKKKKKKKKKKNNNKQQQSQISTFIS